MPRPRKELTPEDEARIVQAQEAVAAAEQNLRDTVIDVSSRASARVMQERFGYAAATVRRWKQG